MQLAAREMEEFEEGQTTSVGGGQGGPLGEVGFKLDFQLQKHVMSLQTAAHGGWYMAQ